MAAHHASSLIASSQMMMPLYEEVANPSKETLLALVNGTLPRMLATKWEGQLRDELLACVGAASSSSGSEDVVLAANKTAKYRVAKALRLVNGCSGSIVHWSMLGAVTATCARATAADPADSDHDSKDIYDDDSGDEEDPRVFLGDRKNGTFQVLLSAEKKGMRKKDGFCNISLRAPYNSYMSRYSM